MHESREIYLQKQPPQLVYDAAAHPSIYSSNLTGINISSHFLYKAWSKNQENDGAFMKYLQKLMVD